MRNPSTDDALKALMARYWPDRPTSRRIPPWTWSALTTDEQTALARFVDDWVHSYNQVFAVNEDDVIPPCWLQHPWLAHELAALAFLWQCHHRDPTTGIDQAAEFYHRHLPAFRTRLPATLGRSPGECQRGQHPTTWRRDTDQRIQSWNRPTTNASTVKLEDVTTPSFGFTDLSS